MGGAVVVVGGMPVELTAISVPLPPTLGVVVVIGAAVVVVVVVVGLGRFVVVPNVVLEGLCVLVTATPLVLGLTGLPVVEVVVDVVEPIYPLLPVPWFGLYCPGTALLQMEGW